jgi:hypothetical protein
MPPTEIIKKRMIERAKGERIRKKWELEERMEKKKGINIFKKAKIKAKGCK